MQMLKQSTAATVLVGPVLDASGAAVTTAVIGDFQATKNGTSAALASPATATHSHNGFYLLALTTGNTDTVGRLVISVNNTAQSMSTHRYTVLLPSVFDALITNATNTTGGLAAATGAITALAGAVSTYAGGDTAGTTTLLTRLPSAITLSSGAVTVGTNNDKTGYSLTPTTGLGNQTANITGNLSGSVGSVTGAVGSVTNRVTANTDQWGGVAVTGMPLPTASYTAPPSASTNATAVRSELATELGRIDAAVSSRSTLTAAGVRTELAVELGRIDAAISSRLAATSYVAPDNATIGTISINLATVNDNVLSRLAASAYTAPPSAATNASAVRSELTTELGRIDAAISSRLATTSYTAPLSAAQTRSALGLASANLDTQLADIPTVTEFEARTLTTANYATATNQTSIKSVTDKLNTGLVLDGAVYQFTANMLELAPGGGGGGSATIENQELILANLDNITGAVSAAVARLQLETQITGFPATICRGSDYDQTLESEIRLQLLDLENNPITEIGGTPVAEITWLFGLGTDRQPRLVAGACSWDDTTDELVIELAAADTDTTPLGSVTWQIGAQIGELVRWLGGGTTRIVERQFTA